MTDILRPEVRAWIYQITLAVIPLLTILGLFTDEIAAQILLIAAAVLGIGSTTLARMNTPPGTGKHGAE